jgi:putative peptide maturation dehydrogenase
MHYRRCAILFLELNQETRFALESLLAGGDGLDNSQRWLAQTAHLDEPVSVELAHAQLLQGLDKDRWYSEEQLRVLTAKSVVDSLIQSGLLIPQEPDTEQQKQWQQRDQQARDVPWWALAAVAMRQGRWQGVDIETRNEEGLMLHSQDLVENFGPAPDTIYRRNDRVPNSLAAPQRNALDVLLSKRKTCRNFDPNGQLSAAHFSTMLHRVWGVIGTLQLAEGAQAVKKTSPAGGGLHAIEAYLLVQRVEGIASGLYHYLPHTHQLECLEELSSDNAKALAHSMVAGQDWFEDAAVYVMMAARFDRIYWKYRNHTKAWRVTHLDAGHLSQTMYLSAADLGLGAFITAAINDVQVEQALKLEPLREGPLCIVGFGPRLDEINTIELENLTPSVASGL